jgi:hypothetical protein
MTAPKSTRPDPRLMTFAEPRLRFAYDQILDDPKDGLMLFGPPEQPNGMQYGVIGTSDGIRQFADWAQKIRRAVPSDPKIGSSITFPGFEAVFRQSWSATPRVTLTIDENELLSKVRLTDPHQRVFDTVDVFADPIRRWVKEEDAKVALWFVIVPEEVWTRCRPNSTISRAEGISPDVHLSHAKALAMIEAPDLFDNANAAAEKHLYENHFHNQLKAKLLDSEAVTQIVRETTIAPGEHLNRFGKPVRKLQDDATVAWNLATGIFYKAGAKPWTLSDIRDGVCYIGLVFKKTNNPKDGNEACCGAQMFLHTGEGIVFKGAVGSWASERIAEFHLPKELFIHGRAAFNKTEIEGFRAAAPEGTSVTGIQIRRPNDLKLFRDGRRAIMRGLALKIDDRNAFLWTSGYVPKLLTYPGREVPTPLKVRVVFGYTDLRQVLADILALTKVNFNACIYADGLPVTLRFADDIGEILTAIPEVSSKPLPFRHYI